jgi:hypothetical protein
MDILQNLLDAYRQGATFPTYQQLQPLSESCPALAALLTDYRQGAPFPVYNQLAALAYA